MNNNDKEYLSSENGWKEYKVYLLNSIEVINDQIKDTKKDLTELKIGVAGLKKDMVNQSRIWGALSGIGGAVIIAILIKGLGL